MHCTWIFPVSGKSSPLFINIVFLASQGFRSRTWIVLTNQEDKLYKVTQFKPLFKNIAILLLLLNPNPHTKTVL